MDLIVRLSPRMGPKQKTLSVQFFLATGDKKAANKIEKPILLKIEGSRKPRESHY